MGGSGAARLQDKPRWPHRPWCPGAAWPGGLRGCHCAVIAGRQRYTHPYRLPPARPPCGPGGGASAPGRGLYANTAGGAGGSACALRARSSTGSYTMHRGRQLRGGGGASHVNKGRVLPRHWRRERKGRDRICKAASRRRARVRGRPVRRVTSGGRGPHANHAGFGGRGSDANTRAAASHPLPLSLLPAALKGAAPAQSAETGT